MAVNHCLSQVRALQPEQTSSRGASSFLINKDMAKTKLLLDASCDQCGTYIGKRRQKIHHKNVFCGRSCQVEFQRIIRYCKQCGDEITSKSAKVFCNHSCAASFNNKGVRRHGNAPGNCARCGKLNPRSDSKYCGMECSRLAQTKYSPEEKIEQTKLLNRLGVARYNAKKKANSPPVSDEEKELIKEFYANCPKGYEVDHIYPISKGGWHVLSNLQYLPMSENRRKQDKIVDNIAPWGYVDDTELR